MRKRRCHDHKTWTLDNWERARDESDESSFTLLPTSGRVYFWRTPKGAYNPECMPGSHSETRGRFCDGLGTNIVVQYFVGPIITLRGRITAREYVDRLGNELNPMIHMLFPNNDAVFHDDNTPFHTAGTVRFSHGLKSMKVNFNIFPCQHNHQIWTLLNHSDMFWRLEWGTDSHLQHLWSNLKMFFKKNSVKFSESLLKTCTSQFQEGLRMYWRQKFVQHHIHKELCVVSVLFP
jgi:hypothetical protein